jgi:competence protein ComEC
MNFWQQAPFARILLPFTGGILSSLFLHIPATTIAVVAIVSLLLYSILFFYVRKRIQLAVTLWSGVVLLVVCWSFGALWHGQYHQLTKQEHFTYHKSKYKIVQVVEAPVKKEKSIKLVVNVEEVIRNQQQEKVIGKLLLYMQKDEQAESIRYGDKLLLNVNERLVEEPRNPGEFNYKRYLMFNNIFHQAYLKSESYKILERNAGNPVFAYAYNTRDKLIAIFKQYVEGEKEFGVSTALVFGYVDELDPELIQSYSNTGTLHVLAVSGMHVGIIFVVLNWMLGFMDRNRKSAMLKAVLIGIFLWGYSMVAGLSPSILRAATMFSFITFGQLINRRSQIYNTLAASAFILILFKPTIIASVGFQLSYAAVLGIVFIQPKLYRLLLFRNYFADLIWKITAVSIAAQITTFPMGLLYFHQFPNYFIFSNLIIIPLTTVILYVGILLIVFSWQSTAAFWIGKAIFWGIKATNLLVESIDRLPFSTLNGISISIPETLLVYVILFTFIGYILLKRAFWMQTALVCALVLAGFNVYEKNEQAGQQYFMVYHVPGHSAMAGFTGYDAQLITDSTLAQNESAIRFYIRHHWWERGITQVNKHPLTLQKNYLLRSGDKKILWVNNGKLLHQMEATDVDAVVLSKNIWVDMPLLKDKFQPEQLIFDGSNSSKKIHYWKKEADKLALQYVDVTTQGAAQINAYIYVR